MSKLSLLLRAGAVGAVVASAAAGAASAQLDRAVEVAQQSTTQGQQNQDQVEQLDDQRTDMARQYRALLQQIESQRLFVEQQRVFLNSQQNEIESLQDQLNRVEGVTVELLPMMREMVVNLENFVQLDLPFQMNERMDRIQRLYDVLQDPSISEAERYRVILNAYEIEASYGRGIAAYEGSLTEGGDEVVDFLRIGRLMLIYATKDGEGYGYWDRESESWQELPGDYGLELNKAFRIANNAAAPDLLLAPVPGPTQSQASEAAFEPPTVPQEEVEERAPEPVPSQAGQPAAPAEGEAAAEGEEAAAGDDAAAGEDAPAEDAAADDAAAEEQTEGGDDAAGNQ